MLSLFIDVESIQVISGFNLKKSPDGTGVQKYIKKTNLKTMISPLLTRPQGPQGCKKIWRTKLKTTLMSWSNKIQAKLNKMQKTFRKQGFFDKFSKVINTKYSKH